MWSRPKCGKEGPLKDPGGSVCPWVLAGVMWTVPRKGHVWFTAATPSYQASDHFTRFGFFFKIKLKSSETKLTLLESVPHSSSSWSYFQSQKKKCWLSQYWPWMVELLRAAPPPPGRGRVGGVSRCNKRDWMGLCYLSRIQDSQRHHRSDWWGTPRRTLLLFREGGKWRGVSDMETGLLPPETGCGLSTRTKW